MSLLFSMVPRYFTELSIHIFLSLKCYWAQFFFSPIMSCMSDYLIVYWVSITGMPLCAHIERSEVVR